LDVSAIDGKVEAAAILIKRGAITNTLHYHLGLDSEHTVYKAELVGLILGLYLIKQEGTRGKCMAIRIDNQAVLKVFQSDLRNPGYHLVRKALYMASMTQK
jgi:hypothetical protein